MHVIFLLFLLLNFAILDASLICEVICFTDLALDYTKVITEVAWKGLYFFFLMMEVCKISLEGRHLCALLRLCRSFKIAPRFNRLKTYIYLKLQTLRSFHN